MTGHSRESILHARRKLVHLLDAIADGVADLSLERCPYRDASDACTFSYGCRNQVRDVAAVRCAGAPLDTSPAQP